MSLVVARNLETGNTRIIDVTAGQIVSLWPGEYVVSPNERDAAASADHQSLLRREVEALEDLAVKAGLRNHLHATALELQREGLGIAQADYQQRERVRSAIFDSEPSTAESVPAGPGVGQREPAGSTSPGQGVGTDSADPLPRLYAILRDPRTSPAGWVSQVKRTYPDRGDAFIEAKRLAAKHGGRFLVLEVTSYAEAMPRIGLGYPGDEPAGLNDLPF